MREPFGACWRGGIAAMLESSRRGCSPRASTPLLPESTFSSAVADRPELLPPAEAGGAVGEGPTRARTLGGEIDNVEDPQRFARTAANLPEFLWPAPGRPNRLAITLGEQALRLLDKRDTALRLLLSARVAAELSYDPRAKARREELAARLEKFADATCDPETLLRILCFRDCLLRNPEMTEERLTNADEITRVSLQLHDHRGIYVGAMARIASLAELGEFQQVDFEAEAAANAATLSGDSRYKYGMLAYRAARTVMDGRFAEAARLFEGCREISDRVEAPELADSCVPALVLFQETGRLGELQVAVRAAVDRHPHEPVYQAMLAWLLLELGNSREAKFHFARLAANDFEPVDAAGDRLACLAALAEVCAQLGDAEAVDGLFNRLRPYADRIVTFASCGFFGAVSRYLGKLAATALRSDEGLRYLEDAIRLNDKSAARLWSAYSRYDLAALLAHRDGPGDRTRALRLAAALFREVASMGTIALATKLEALQADLADRDVGSAISQTKTASSNYSEGARASQVSFPRVFQCEGDVWTIAYDGSSARLRNNKGLTLIAHLLSHPGQRFHVVDLELVGARAPGYPNGLVEPDLGPAIDAQAKKSYRTRLCELKMELAEARRLNDQELTCTLEQEASFLTQELARTVGLGGRDRRAGSEVERVRLRVTKAIKSAISKVSKHHPALALYLRKYVITGNFCLYVAEPSSPSWRF
jgi:tetratricopeptide (TPR) repeat protein